jgi:PHP family Zn ribbon phosphoesterase
LRFFTADLHIHTVLSPCAEAEMLPELILERAQELRLDLVAVTDHNSAENAAAMLHMAAGTGIIVWPGMEVQSREEAHLLCLFDTLTQVARWQEIVYANLPPLKNKPAVFGEQVVLGPDGEPIGYNDRLLATSTFLAVEEVVQGVADLGGLCIPAHVDRPAYSLIANLGFIPSDLGIPGVEISHLLGPQEVRARFPQLVRYGLIADSDAHRLSEMRRRTTLKMVEPTVAELARALAGVGERGVWVDGVRSSGEVATRRP